MNGTLDRGASVLVDTNTIIEAWRTRAWAALAGGWRVETVEDCVIRRSVPAPPTKPRHHIGGGLHLTRRESVASQAEYLEQSNRLQRLLVAVDIPYGQLGLTVLSDDQRH